MSDSIEISWKPGDDPTQLRDREWLVTNGLGGYASSTLLGPVSRRHHGLFVPNLSEPSGRHVMISTLDEEITAHGTPRRLAGVEREDTLEAAAHEHLTCFSLARGVPTWRFIVEGRVLERTVVMPHAKNTVLVHYKLLEGPPLPMRLRIYAAFRRVDETILPGATRNFDVTAHLDHEELKLSGGDLCMRTSVSQSNSAFVSDPRDGGVAFLRIERDRGYEADEGRYSPGYYDVELTDSLTFVATTEDWASIGAIEGAKAIADEAGRKAILLDIAGPALQADFPAQLVAAADQFIAIPGSRKADIEASGGELRTIMAGYHWFADWGRDTMISLEGLTITTGRLKEANAILRTFARYVKDGLLPNLFPEGARQALYHTVDATLWYFHGIERYRRAAKDDTIVHDLFPVLADIVDHYVNGTLYGIGVDKDGLVKEGEDGYQLTWMDAKVDGWVVTPRRGKPVEIQALWFNALSLMASWCKIVEKPDVYTTRAEAARASFEKRFPATRGLYDVVDCPDGKDDAACRPNQIFTISLDHPILDKARWEAVLGVVERELLTPMGLRTLSRDNPDYHAHYEGNLRARDAAYHQGTVWPWLLGHYVDAVMKVRGDKAAARKLLDAFPAHLREAGVGSISEITDAEAPYFPRGCIAQAWSVAEVLRAYKLTG